MTDLNLKSFDKLYPMNIHKYESLLPSNDATLLDKINKIIEYLNSVGKLTNDVVKNWNLVYQWTMNDGLTADVNAKLEDMLAKGQFDPIFNTAITKIGDVTTLTTTDKTSLTKAVNELVLKMGNLANLTTTDKSSLVNSINENTSKLAEKAAKTYVDSQISTIGNASPKGTYTTLAALQTAFPTGTIGVYVVTADGNWYYWNGSAWTAGGLYQSTGIANNSIVSINIAKKGVHSYHTSFAQTGKNKFNKNAVTNGGYVNTGGAITVNASYCYSDYISSDPNTAHYYSNGYNVAEYDVNRTFIKVQWINNVSFTTDPNTAFIILSNTIANIGTMQLELGTSFTGYENFGYKLINPAPKQITIDLMEQTLQDVLNKGKNKKIREIMSVLVESATTKKVKLLGDSITAGQGGTGYALTGEVIQGTNQVNVNGHCWANSLKGYFESKFNCSVKNFGVSGKDSSWLYTYVADGTLVKSDDDIVVCMIGTNDRLRVKTDLHYLIDNMKGIYNYVKGLGKEIIFMSNIPASISNESSLSIHMEDIDHYISKATADLGIEYISVYKLFNEYCQSREITIDSLLSDGLHPNDNGYDAMFYLISNALGFGTKRPGATW